jgi:acyltransferase
MRGPGNDEADGAARLSATVRPRITGIDLFRGALLALVMLGHFAELTERHHFLTWFGYGFRMPLFIGLTGYMFNLDAARSMSPAGLLRKYYGRLILPWIVACAVALAITGALEWRSPVYAIIRPPYHLWFVPVMMAFILAASITRLSPARMVAVALPLSIGSMYLFGVGHDVGQLGAWVPDRRYFIYPVYFALGIWAARRQAERQYDAALLAVSLAGMLWWAWLYHYPSTAGEAAAELLLCVPLIVLFPRLKEVRFDIPLLSAVGRDSLFFYLWHPFSFAFWGAAGASGVSLLMLSTGSILVAWVAFGRATRLARILGVKPTRVPAQPLPPAPAPLSDAAPVTEAA